MHHFMKSDFALAALAVAVTLAPSASAKSNSQTLSKEQAMADVKKGIDLYATFDTSQGTIVCKLFTKAAPKTVENFVGLATGSKQ